MFATITYFFYIYQVNFVQKMTYYLNFSIIGNVVSWSLNSSLRSLPWLRVVEARVQGFHVILRSVELNSCRILLKPII